MNIFRQNDIYIGVFQFPIPHFSFPIPHFSFLIPHSSFLIPHFIEVDDDFFATVEGVGDYGVFREIGAE